MPDLEDPADVPVETAQDAVEPTEPSSEAAPFDGDFDADRARRTIDHLRQREKELETQAKQFERLQNDPDAFREFVSEQGYEIPEDEPELVDDEPEPSYQDPRVDQLLAERDAERRTRAILEQASVDVAKIQEDLGRDLTEAEINELGSLAIPDDKGMPRMLSAYEKIKAFNELQKPAVTPARTPTRGAQGSEKFDIRDPEQRRKRMASILEAGSGD